MKRLVVAVFAIALLLALAGAGQAGASGCRTTLVNGQLHSSCPVKKRCKTVLLHAQLHRTCTAVKKKRKKKVAPKPLPVTTTLLDGTTVTTANGTFGLTGTLKGTIPAKVQLNTPTVATFKSVTLVTPAGAPCATPQLAATFPGEVVLNADGTVFAELALVMPDCGGATTLLAAGKVGSGGLNSLVLDTIDGAVTAHLVVKVDLSG